MRFAQDFKDRDRLGEKGASRTGNLRNGRSHFLTGSERDKDLCAYLEPTLVSGRDVTRSKTGSRRKVHPWTRSCVMAVTRPDLTWPGVAWPT